MARVPVWVVGLRAMSRQGVPPLPRLDAGSTGVLPRRFGPFATTPFTRSRARLTNRLIEPSDQRAPLRAFSASLPPRCGAADRGYTAMVIYGCANPKRQIAPSEPSDAAGRPTKRET